MPQPDRITNERNTMINNDAATSSHDGDTANALGADHQEATEAVFADLDKSDWILSQSLLIDMAMKLYGMTYKREFLEVAAKTAARLKAMLQAETKRMAAANARIDHKR
jgi:hypothetical protein